MITARITKGENLGKKFRDSIPNIESGVQKEVMRLALKMTGVVMGKLSGAVLNVRTGRLRRSIHPEWEFKPGYSGATVGSNVEYAAIHEFGGTIRFPSRPLKIYTKNYKNGESKSWVMQKGKRMYGGGGESKAYELHMPERSFLRSALREMTPEIIESLRKAVATELQKISQ